LVLNGTTEMASFFAFDPAFQGGVRVGIGDLNGDGKAEIITGGAVGASGHILILDGVTGEPISSFFGMGARFKGGIRVATVGVTEGGVATLRVIGAPNPDRTATINELTPDGTATGQFQPFGASFSGGLFVASVTSPINEGQ
jgi:serralysin